METMTLFSIIAKGGFLMIPIILCSIIIMAVALERYLTYRSMRISIPVFMMKVRSPLLRGDIVGAIHESAMMNGPVATVVKAGLEKVNHGRDSIKESMETAGNSETYRLEKNLSVLATLAGVAPMLGFLGTVTGMIKAFMKIQQLSGNVNADVLAGGIWEAMVTTAAGLTVGIPAMILYNYYVNRVKEFVFEMGTAADEVLDIINRIGTQREEIPQQKPQPMPISPDSPPSHDHLREMRLAHQTFNPADTTIDGGTTL
jgi:biopolymer transport protein ExbB